MPLQTQAPVTGSALTDRRAEVTAEEVCVLEDPELVNPKGTWSGKVRAGQLSKTGG